MVPPLAGGELARVAAADPLVRTLGTGNGSSRSEAPPVFAAVSATWTRCSPAERRRGDAARESASAAGASIAIAAVLAAAGARVAPVLDSVPLADARQETVPLPEASNVQVKSRLPPECRTRPDAEAGCETMATAALPVVAATGGGRSERTTSAPPEFVAVSVSEGRCSPAEIRAGPATAEIARTPASCASTAALVIDPVEGVIEGSFPSVPCALARNATWPADLAEVVQMNETLWPPCSTAMVPAETSVMASRLAVVPAAVAGAAGETLVASAWPVFCTTNVSWRVCPTLTRVRSVVNLPVNCAGACNTRSAVDGDTVAAPPPCTVPDPLAVSWDGPAEFAVTWKVNVAELPGARFCAVSAGPLIVRVPSPGPLRCESEAMAVSTAVCPLLVSWTLRLSACPTDIVAGTPTRFEIRPPGRSTARGALVRIDHHLVERRGDLQIPGAAGGDLDLQVERAPGRQCARQRARSLRRHGAAARRCERGQCDEQRVRGRRPGGAEMEGRRKDLSFGRGRGQRSRERGRDSWRVVYDERESRRSRDGPRSISVLRGGGDDDARASRRTAGVHRNGEGD